MKKFIAPAVGLVLLGLAGCGAASEPTAPAPSSRSQSEQATPQVGGKDVAFGETAGIEEEGGQFAVTAGPLQDVTEFSTPPEVGKYVSTDVSAELLGGTGGAVASVDFMLVDGAGNQYPSAAPNGTDMTGVLFATLLAKGDSGSGKVFFDVPADATGLKLVYQPLTATEPIGSWS
ncbi:DUF4352 domain-containing protein [Saccharopolyspora hirsuta]|uniref:DUF4352 domain-containing protein n=1 Tax=Saccharopolyspora hirsuta TaxID=1837 RepID=A0A5M7C2A2_SACHI|nr:DUF4352 domain-containing protein [Saccharopolyspora hirsuta]KAA5836082.1 DUF4352 domain-containing protein [Saccharopolyspora hirsuta]